MTEQLRHGLVAKMPAVKLTGEVEIDEVYVVAGHKGQLDEVAERGGSGAAAGWQARGRSCPRFLRRSRWKGNGGCDTLEKDKRPILGLFQRGGQVVLRMLANVQQRTIKPIIKATVIKGTLVHTDEYSIYARLPAWGYRHKTVCHGRGEYARDEDGVPSRDVWK